MSSTIEKISEVALRDVQRELERLLGFETTLILRSGALIRYDDFIDRIDSESIVVSLEFDGAGDVKGALAVTRKTAIRISGKLLMLPAAELNRSIADGDFDEEYRFAYSEIVKCIVGAFVQALPKSVHKYAEIRCTNQSVTSRGQKTSLKEVLQSDQPYFQTDIGVSLAGVEQDDMLLMLPAIMVVGACDSAEDESAHALPADSTRQYLSSDIPVSDSLLNHFEGVGRAADTTLFHTFLNSWVSAVSSEIDRTFGLKIEAADMTRQAFNAEMRKCLPADAYSLAAEYRVDGPVSGAIFACSAAEDVLRIGAAFTGMDTSNFSSPGGVEGVPTSDLQDGFNELLAIILTRCGDMLSDAPNSPPAQRGLFVVTRSHSVLIGGDVERPEVDEVLIDQEYVIVSILVETEGVPLGYVNILFPAPFSEQLELYAGERIKTSDADNSVGASELFYRDSVSQEMTSSGDLQESQGVLLIDASEYIAQSLSGVLAEEQFSFVRVSIQSEELQELLTRNFRCVFLAVGKMDEMAMSAIIKVSSTCDQPLVVAAPQWTQTQVVTALRYGASDIAVTPIDGRELRGKMENLS